MQALEGVGDNLIAAWRPDGATEAEVQDMNKLALSILAERLPVPRLHRRPPAGVHAAVELRVQPGRPRPRLRVLDDRGRPARRLPDLGVPRHVALRRDHPAGPSTCWAPPPCGPERAAAADTNDLDDLTLDDDGYFSVILSAERPDGPRRRLVAARPAGAAAPHAAAARATGPTRSTPGSRSNASTIPAPT